ncbi:N-acetylmuramoyl-L-alanine amidase [Bacteroidales bacterium MSK.15.36]|nr:N-acetylmuramoyl-L-alanine amidase [Bacteroidales bacterium MSK.15.36]
MRIALSAGHNVYIGSNFDCGAVGNGKREADITKATVKNLISLLEAQGHKVKDVTPYNQKFSEKKSHHLKRCREVDKFKANLYLDIHINAGGGTGVEVWTYSANSKATPHARKISHSIYKNIGIPNRGVKYKPGFWSVSLCKAPAMIIEGAFIDTLSDMKKLTPGKYAEAIAECFGSVNLNSDKVTITLQKGAKGSQVKILQRRLKDLGYYKGNIDGSFGPATYEAVKAFQRKNGLSIDGSVGPATRAVLNNNTAKPNIDKKLYRVQTGAFSVRKNADDLLKKLKAKGYDAIIVQDKGLYKVQTGAFSKRENADKLVAKLRRDGFEAFVI